MQKKKTQAQIGTKKGSVFDIAGLLLIFFTSAVVVLLVAYFVSAFNTQVETIPLVADNDPAMLVLHQGEDSLHGMDSLFPVFVILMCIVTLISAYLTPTNPVFFLVFILLIILLVPIAAVFSNAYAEIYSSTTLADTADHYPITITIMESLPVLTVVFSALIAVVMWFRGKGGGMI